MFTTTTDKSLEKIIVLKPLILNSDWTSKYESDIFHQMLQPQTLSYISCEVGPFGVAFTYNSNEYPKVGFLLNDIERLLTEGAIQLEDITDTSIESPNSVGVPFTQPMKDMLIDKLRETFILKERDISESDLDLDLDCGDEIDVTSEGSYHIGEILDYLVYLTISEGECFVELKAHVSPEFVINDQIFGNGLKVIETEFEFPESVWNMTSEIEGCSDEITVHVFKLEI